jgi:hypothetical protein
MNANGKSAVPSSIEHYLSSSVTAASVVSGWLERERVICQDITIEKSDRTSIGKRTG